MTRQQLLTTLRTQFDEHIEIFEDRSATRVYVDIVPAGLREMVQFLFVEQRARFNIASGVDTRFAIEILYHFTIERLQLLISLRVKLDRDHPRIDSLTPIIKGSEWIERELHELLGVNFNDHPNMSRLLLPDEWPDGVYPLRTDYQEWDSTAIRNRGV